MAYDVFVSYSSQDKVVADAAVSFLEKNNVRCWYAPRDIKPGLVWGDEIEKAISECKIFLLIFSGDANRSHQVLDELNLAVSEEAMILPFRIENLKPTGAMKLHLSSRHWLDAYDPSWEMHLNKLTKTIATFLGRNLGEIEPNNQKKKKARKWLLVAAVALVVIGLIGIGILIIPGNNDILIKFTDDKGALNPDLRWDVGSSSQSKYIPYSGDTIELDAGPSTWPFFPTLTYKYTVRNNFSVQIELDFTSPYPYLKNAAHMAGLIIRPVNAQLVMRDERFPDNWVVNRKEIADDGHSIGCRGSTMEYNEPIAYFKIDKSGNIWRCAYSKDGQHWIWAEPKIDESLLQNKIVEIVLFAYSTNEESVKATFRNWIITENK